MGVGERVREVREKAGLTQAEFGRVLGVSKNTQVRYEKGHRRPDSAYLLAVAENFGADINSLLHGQLIYPFRLRWDGGEENDAVRAAFETLVPHDLDKVLEWLDSTGLTCKLTAEEVAILTTFRDLDDSGRATLRNLFETIAKAAKR